VRLLLRALAGLLAVVLLAAAVFLVPTIWGKPWKIEHYYLRVLVEFALDHPMVLSYARVLEPHGIDFHSDDLEDLSVAGTDRMADQVDRFLAGLREYEYDEQTPEQQLSTDVLGWFLEARAAGRPFRFHAYPVNQFQGQQSALPDFMINIHAIHDAEDAEHHVARLRKFDVALDQMIEQVEYRESLGVVPPRFVIEAVLEEIEGFLAGPIEEHPVYADLAADLGKLDLDDREVADLLADAREALEEDVFPGYERLADVLRGQLGRATDDAGVWKLPDGDAYYRWALRWHTTTDLTPDEIHALGRAEVARIREAMRAAFAEAGREVGDPIIALDAVAEEERFHYRDTEAARERILADYRAIVADAESRLPVLFGRLPEAPLAVERVPPFKEDGSAGAYYHAPSFDGSRPGTFFANLRAPAEVQKFGMRTLTYHEAIPGHHLQIALAFEMEGQPFFRRVIPFTAFVEGWALYAERLALEQGWHPTPYDELGALQAEMFRAVRLVVDTGIHAKRWSRERAFNYMLRNTGQPPVEVQAEIDRYIVMPGQACAYKMGQLEILELRERARERLGDRFDLRAFHDVVLGQGSLPLEVLEQVVERWIEAQARA
jgi:uncharacterized protein (DUF885 family)